jgi:cell division protein FtsL
MDPRVSRTAMLALSGALVVVVCALAVVGLRVQSVHLGYRLDSLRAERGEVAMLLRQLEVELATLRSPARIEARARDLGLVAPAREQVRLAREYIAGDSGVAAARHGHVEARVR